MNSSLPVTLPLRSASAAPPMPWANTWPNAPSFAGLAACDELITIVPRGIAGHSLAAGP